MLNIVLDGVEKVAPAVSSSAAAAAAPAASSSKVPFKLTNKCQHGPKDRCIHCASGELGKEVKMACNHGPNATCIHCTNFKLAARGACNHPPTAFCINCAPEESKDPNAPNVAAEAAKRMFCHCKPVQKCIHCIQQVAAVKVDIVPFRRLIQERQALCHFKHGPDTQCPACAPEPLASFKGNPKCTNGHVPWPGGCCSKCMPPNAVVKAQGYRHCDYVSFQDDAIGQKFVSTWLLNPFLQRAALLIGNFIEEPAETKNPGAVRALVQAVYYPPQDNQVRRGRRPVSVVWKTSVAFCVSHCVSDHEPSFSSRCLPARRLTVSSSNQTPRRRPSLRSPTAWACRWWGGASPRCTARMRNTAASCSCPVLKSGKQPVGSRGLWRPGLTVRRS